MDSLRKTAWGSRSVFHPLNPHWFMQKLCRLIFLALEPWAGVPVVGLGLLAPVISLLNFYPPHEGERPAFLICTLPTSLDGCGFCNSIVVRLAFNSISEVLSDGCSIF